MYKNYYSLVLTLTVFVFFTISSCTKKDDTPITTNPSTRTDSLTFVAEIGSAGTALNQFNFVNSGSDVEWSLTNDNSFVYVADRGNNCIKKVDLVSNNVVGWYGYYNGIWGYYTNNNSPDKSFTPTRLMFKNNCIYAVANRQSFPIRSRIYKINSTNGILIDSSRLINVYSFFSCCICCCKLPQKQYNLKIDNFV